MPAHQAACMFATTSLTLLEMHNQAMGVVAASEKLDKMLHMGGWCHQGIDHSYQ